MDFLEEIEKSLQQIERNPDIYPIHESNIHKYTVRRFPFSIFYVLEKK